MRRGYLSQYFDGVAIKRLSVVEADETRSNQHEYNATRPMLEFMGRPTEATRLDTRFISRAAPFGMPSTLILG